MNDSHAEVIARRAFVAWVWAQLAAAADTTLAQQHDAREGLTDSTPLLVEVVFARTDAASADENGGDCECDRTSNNKQAKTTRAEVRGR